MSYADDKVKQRLFNNSEIKDPLCPVFEFVQDLIHVYIISKFKAYLIKTEGVIVMTKSNRGFFSNEGDKD